ncbi:LysE family translocator [Cryobacterium sp. TMT1-3]|uniref:LysE family translocator n=1 Tax=Cryobacterium sp. TMT1-3 TaxID=1259237 RepID=UPI00106A1611|nr:LysE family translocator [Cryobacterium sp. TMT1-3]TFC25413.1 LysE family translocator [Cryobacterium sp. TMT1-3]
MTISQAILGFAAVAAILTVIPGLDTTLVLRSALVRGRRQAVATAFGIATGALIWGAAAALGAAALLAASHLAYQVVTIGGALYMGYLGVSMIVKSFRRTGNGHADALTESASLWRSFLTGTWTNLLNPKIGVFYIATIPQFIPEGASPLAMGLLLSAVHALMSLVWFAIIIIGANAARRWLAHARALRIIDRFAGTVLIGFGATLALEHR